MTSTDPAAEAPPPGPRTDEGDTPARPAVALVGAGNAGGAIGARLLARGHDLAVFDIDPAARDALVRLGAEAHPDAARAAATADVTILSLNTAAIVREAVFGEGGVAHGAPPGATIVDMSSIDPETTRELGALARKADLHWLDCPLSGGAPKAATGELAVFAGGDPERFERVRPVLDSLSTNCTLVGGPGAGQTVKMINQVLASLNLQAVAEATRLALDAGLDPSRIPAALAGGRADGAILREYMPKMAGGNATRTGRLDNMLKDLDAALALAGRLGTRLPATSLCADVHRGLVERGLGDRDITALMVHYEPADARESPVPGDAGER